jgi:DNA-binding GntR family transcriptional regulator
MYEEQIEYREQLLEYHKVSFETVKKQLQELKSKQTLIKSIQEIGILPIDLSRMNTTFSQVAPKYTTAEGIKQINKFLPQKEVKDSRILVIDIKYLPADPKEEGELSDELREYLEEQYGYKVFLIDSSRVNLQDSPSNTHTPPIYFI